MNLTTQVDELRLISKWHIACRGGQRKAPAIRRAPFPSAPEVPIFAESFASTEVGEAKLRWSPPRVWGNTPDRLSPTVPVFPTSGHSSSIEQEKMSDKKFDGTILGRMQAFLDFISDISWPPSLLLCMFFVASPMSLAARTTATVGKDLHSNVTRWKAGAERMFGYTASQMVGQSIIRLIPTNRQDDEEKKAFAGPSLRASAPEGRLKPRSLRR